MTALSSDIKKKLSRRRTWSPWSWTRPGACRGPSSCRARPFAYAARLAVVLAGALAPGLAVVLAGALARALAVVLAGAHALGFAVVLAGALALFAR